MDESAAIFVHQLFWRFISGGGTGEIVWNMATLNMGVAVRREITVVVDNATAGDSFMLSAELSYDGRLETDNRSEFAVSVAKAAGIASLLSVDVMATPQPVAYRLISLW